MNIKKLKNSIDNFFNDKLDVTVSGIENVFSKYVANVYEDLSFNDYIKIIKGIEVKHELYEDYKKSIMEILKSLNK